MFKARRGLALRVALCSFQASVSFLVTPVEKKGRSLHNTPGQAHEDGTVLFPDTGVT